VVDRTVLAAKIAAIRDAVARIRAVLPETEDAFLADRTVREIVTLNLFVAVQDAIALAAHWLADEGWDVPRTLGEIFEALGAHGVLDPPLASRLRSAAGLRNLIAHQDGIVDAHRLFAIASGGLDDLLDYCRQLAERCGEDDSGLA
jgi:uncharacterized protein YutE (UPF0331/DUF86 family)